MMINATDKFNVALTVTFCELIHADETLRVSICNLISRYTYNQNKKHHIEIN